MLLMCLGPLALVLVGIQVGRLRDLVTRYHDGRRTTVIIFTTRYLRPSEWVWWVAAILVVGALLAWRRHGLRRSDPFLTPQPHPPGMWLTLAFFIVGIVVGVAVRLDLGYLYVSGFAGGSAPLVGGLLVGILFQGAPGGEAAHDLYRQRQLGVIYMLAGAVCTALGNIPGYGWFYGSCFLVICGSLAAACYVVMGIVLAKIETVGP
jgi:hypothetical protein